MSCFGLFYLEIRDKALRLRATLLNKGVYNTDAFGVADKFGILGIGNLAIEGGQHPLHRRILIHKADVNIITVGIIDMLQGELCLSNVRRQKKNSDYNSRTHNSVLYDGCWTLFYHLGYCLASDGRIVKRKREFFRALGSIILKIRKIYIYKSVEHT